VTRVPNARSTLVAAARPPATVGDGHLPVRRSHPVYHDAVGHARRQFRHVPLKIAPRRTWLSWGAAWLTKELAHPTLIESQGRAAHIGTSACARAGNQRLGDLCAL